jgi:hypothetical protein
MISGCTETNTDDVTLYNEQVITSNSDSKGRIATLIKIKIKVRSHPGNYVRIGN